MPIMAATIGIKLVAMAVETVKDWGSNPPILLSKDRSQLGEDFIGH